MGVRADLVLGIDQHVLDHAKQPACVLGTVLNNAFQAAMCFAGGVIVPRIGLFVGRLQRGNGAPVALDHGEDRIWGGRA